MRLSQISFLSQAEKITLSSYRDFGDSVPAQLMAQVASRLAAMILLSPAAALDICFHTVVIIPVAFYSFGKGEFSQIHDHLQRIQNAVAPLILGSVCGLIHPYMGIFMSEPTDKHIFLGILSSHTNNHFETPCSPIHTYSLVEELAETVPYEPNGKFEIFTKEHLKAIREVKKIETSLECLQTQEYIHKITNLTLYAMAAIKLGLDKSYLGFLLREGLVRSAGLLIPLFATIDFLIAETAQALFLTTGIIRAIADRGPLYTEVTVNPLMHVAFLIQSTLKLVGTLFASPIWFFSPLAAFQVSLFSPLLFFKLQKNHLLNQIEKKLDSANEKSKLVLPILFGEGMVAPFAVPTHTMHKTYLIAEKKNGRFDLYWVNRPDITQKKGLTKQEALEEMRSMLSDRFPYMNFDKIFNYPVTSEKPKFSNSTLFSQIASQGNNTNCVVSNLFGMLETIDILNGQQHLAALRYQSARKFFFDKCALYQYDLFPFCANTVLSQVKNFSTAPI